jgi:hypothetical protein
MRLFHFKGIREDFDSETLRKVVLLYVFLSLGFLLLVVMGIIAFVQHAVLLILSLPPSFLSCSFTSINLGMNQPPPVLA